MLRYNIGDLEEYIVAEDKAIKSAEFKKEIRVLDEDFWLIWKVWKVLGKLGKLDYETLTIHIKHGKAIRTWFKIFKNWNRKSRMYEWF